MPRQIVEQLHDVLRDTRIAREEPDIGIEARGAHVVIAGADVDVASQPGRFLANHQRQSSRGSSDPARQK